MKPRVSAWFFFLCAQLFAADPKWIRMKSEHFEMYSTAGERATRDTLKSFEQVHDFFHEQMHMEDLNPAPVRLVVFNSDKEYGPYRPNEGAIAFYSPGMESDTIVMSHTGLEAQHTAVHEYTHLVISHAGLKFPPWLNEGLAEIYSTLRQNGGKIVVGEIIQGRRYELFNSKWTPLSIILDADHNSPYYNEKNKMGALYNEGWALTHMLMLDQRYMAKFGDVLKNIVSGMPSAEAIATVYGTPLSEIDKDVQGYIRGDRFYARVFSAKLEKITDSLPAEPAADYDVKLILTELSPRQGQEKETRQKLEALIAEDPKRFEPYAQLGYLATQQGNYDEAEQFFEKAFKLGDRSRTMLWDYGRMAIPHHPAEAAEALQELVNQEPGRVEARIELASALLRNHQPGAAVAMLNQTKGLTAADAPRFFLQSTYGYLDLKDMANARKNLEQALKYAKEDRDREEAGRLKTYLDQVTENKTVTARAAIPAAPVPGAAPAVAPKPPATVPAPDGDPDNARPRLRRASDGSKVEIYPGNPSMEGTFAELRCEGQAKIVLRTSEGQKVFVIEDPNKIVVAGKPGGKTDLECGAQKPVALKVEYDPAKAAPGTDGAVRTLYFQ